MRKQEIATIIGRRFSERIDPNKKYRDRREKGEEYFTVMIETMEELLLDGEEIRFPYFGKLTLKETGGGKKYVRFVPFPSLKEKLRKLKAYG